MHLYFIKTNRDSVEKLTYYKTHSCKMNKLSDSLSLNNNREITC